MLSSLCRQYYYISYLTAWPACLYGRQIRQPAKKYSFGVLKELGDVKSSLCGRCVSRRGRRYVFIFQLQCIIPLLSCVCVFSWQNVQSLCIMLEVIVGNKQDAQTKKKKKKNTIVTETLRVNLFVFAYRLFHEDFSPLDGTKSLCIKLPIEHSTMCDSRPNLNYAYHIHTCSN